MISEWAVWENPEWWEGEGHGTGVGDQRLHAWSVLGSPYAARVEAMDANMRAGAFRGPWTWQKLETAICKLETAICNDGYDLEDMPPLAGRARRVLGGSSGEPPGADVLGLPEDADPAEVGIEGGRRVKVLGGKRLERVSIRGLTFRLTNVHWGYTGPAWAHADVGAS